jgi:hypothetical protein
MAALCASAQPLLPRLSPGQLVQLLQHMAALNYTPPPAWMDAASAALAPGVDALAPAQLAGLLWAVSNLSCAPPPALLQAALDASRQQLQDFLAPDLALAASAVGALLGGGVPRAWAAAVVAEAEFQLVEYNSDWRPFDLARLIIGLSSMLRQPEPGSEGGAGAAPAAAASSPGDPQPSSSGRSLQEAAGAAEPQVTERFMTALMKAVYASTRTIEEKAAVDFALAMLAVDDRRSMHFDTRWTHEELKWLPRRERDKRRILKDGWYRTKWGGWSGGGGS